MNETNEGQSIPEIIIDVEDSDDEVVICEQYEIIEVDDDESNGESSSTRNPQPAPKTMLQPEVPTNQQFAEEAKRIPIDKVTVELLCEYLGVDFKPEWSLQHIRKIFKDRTKMHKNTPEIQDAIARKALWCRRIVIKFLPNWFQIYHVITLIRLLSSFDVNKPTYRVQVTQAGKKNKLRKLDRENSNRCYIDFLYIEDCRQLLYDLQGLQCFKHNIPVNSAFGMLHKSKPNSMLNALTRIKEFRLDQGNWCPITEGMVEIHDSEENSSQSYSFPLLADIQNNFKERIDPVLKVSKQNEKKTMSFVKTSKEKVRPDNDNCRTVVMDKIPITWGKFHIHNLIRDIFSQKMEFHTSILDENNDNTVKYLVKFATHAQAAKVCTALNGFFIENKKLQVRFERGQDFDETLSALAKKLVSGASPENCQSRRIKQSPLLPTTRAVHDEVSSHMKNTLPRPPVPPQPLIYNNFNDYQNPYFPSPNPYFASRNPHFASPNPHFAPQNPHFASRNSHFAPRNPHFASRNPHFTSRNPHYASRNPHIQHNRNKSIPLIIQNRNRPSNKKITRGKVTKPSKSKIAKEPKLFVQPKIESKVKKEEAPIESASQAKQPIIPIQTIKQEIVVKKELGYVGTVIKKEPNTAQDQNNQLPQQYSSILQNIKKERQ